MTTELATIGSQSVDMLNNPDQIRIIKEQLAPGISDGELAHFIQVCRHKGLDPLAREIHAVMRYDNETQRKKLTIQVGIDGFRSLAEDTGEYDGSTPPQWCGKDANWRDVWIDDDPPVACKVGARRKGFTDVQWAIGRYSAYVQTNKDGSPNSMWKKRGPEQLAKCIEACALRMAFPRKLGGLYTHEEMAQADNETAYKESGPFNSTPLQTNATQPDYKTRINVVITEVNATQETFRKYRAVFGIPADLQAIDEALQSPQHKSQLWGMVRHIHHNTVTAYKECEVLDWPQMYQNIQDCPEEVLESLKELQHGGVTE